MRHLKDYTKKTAAGLSLVFLTACASVGVDDDYNRPAGNAVNDNDSHLTTTSLNTPRNDAPVNVRRDEWYNPLPGESSGKLLIHKLIEDGNVMGLRQILREGYDVNAGDDFDRTAVWTLAARWGRLDRSTREDMFSALKAHDADFLKADSFGVRPLVEALVKGHADLRDRLLAEGDDMNRPGHSRWDKPSYPVLKVASEGTLESFRYMVRQGVDLHVRDRDGKGVVDHILMEASANRQNLEKLELVNSQRGFDIGRYLENNPDSLIEAFNISLGQKDDILSNASYLRRRNDNLTRVIGYLDTQRLDFNRIVHSETKETLAHKLAAFNNMPMFDLLERRGFRHWGRENAHGATATDYAMIYGGAASERFLRNRNVGSTLEIIRRTPLTETGLDTLVDRYHGGDIRTPKSMSPRDVNELYRMYPVLRRPSYNSGNKPVVAVTGVTMHYLSIKHLDDTVTVVNGTMNRLSGNNSTVRLMGFSANPKNPENLYTSSGSLLSPLLLTGLLENKAREGTPVILSHSVGYSFERMENEDLRKLYQAFNNDRFERKSDYFLRLNPIGHFSNGNNGEGSCAPIESAQDRETCFRAPDMFRVSARSVHVGAAERTRHGDWVVHDYSDSQPTYCAGLPYQRSERLFYGTSFAAPASAGVEAELFSLHGRSPNFPQGVSHEDIMLALHLTADRNIIDERTGLRERFNENAAGVGMSERCGAGVIRPDRANDLLEEMVRATERGQARPTEYRNHEVQVETQRPGRGAQQVSFDNGRQQGYVYEIRVPETGYATKPYIHLNFEQNNKGEAYMISPRGTATNLRPSVRGHADTDSFWGERWEAGEVIRLVTSRPLKDDGTRAFIRLAPPDSAFGHMVRQKEQESRNRAGFYMTRRP